MTFAPASFTVLSTPLTESIPVLFTCLSMQLFIHSASRCSEDPAMLQAQSSQLRTQRWRVPAPEGHQKKTDGWMRNHEMYTLFFLHLHFTSITAISEYFPMWISSSVRATHRCDLESTSYLLRPGDLYQPSLWLSSTGSPSIMLAFVLFPFSIFRDQFVPRLSFSPFSLRVHPFNTSYLIFRISFLL